MFERFAEDARRAVVLAQEEARAAGAGSIGTEHLLLGLVRAASGLGARLLRDLGISEGRVRSAIGDASGTGTQPVDGALALTGSAARALQAAIREADALGHDVVGTEHLLIALAPESASSPAAADVTGTRLLSDLGVDADRLRETLSETRQRGRPSHEPPPPAQRVADKLARLSEARLDTAQLLETLAVTLDLAQEEAVYFGRPGADGGDLLIALAAGRDPVVDKALAELGLDADAVRAAVEHARGDDSPG